MVKIKVLDSENKIISFDYLNIRTALCAKNRISINHFEIIPVKCYSFFFAMFRLIKEILVQYLEHARKVS